MARRDRGPLTMASGEREAGVRDRSLQEMATHESVIAAVLSSRCFVQEGWRLVVNRKGRSIFGVAPGLYPDVVALDGSDAGVAWVLEVATPSTIIDEGAWERWAQIAATGISFILAVPFGAGRMTERAAEMLDVKAGLVYEYGVTPDRVFFTLTTRGARNAAA